MDRCLSRSSRRRRRKDTATIYEYPVERIGDLAVGVSADIALGWREQEHDLSGRRHADGRLQGGRGARPVGVADPRREHRRRHQPATLGLLRRVIDETLPTGQDSDHPAAVEEAQALASAAWPLRERAYELVQAQIGDVRTFNLAAFSTP